jgi:hypothetical protein
MKRNRILLLLLVSLTTAVNLSGCITAERCRDRFPESTNRVTTIIDTTIVTSSTEFDTIIRINSLDTIFVLDKNTDIRVKILRLPGDSIFVSSECPPDTILIKSIRTETTIERITNLALKGGKGFYLSIFLFLFAVLVLSLFINSLKK